MEYKAYITDCLIHMYNCAITEHKICIKNFADDLLLLFNKSRPSYENIYYLCKTFYGCLMQKYVSNNNNNNNILYRDNLTKELRIIEMYINIISNS